MTQRSNGMSTRVSVIIPEFQDLRAANAAHAMLAQTLPAEVALEIIIVDDASGQDIVQRLRSGLPPLVQLIELTENLGRGGARQAGIAAASGEFILLLDSDCEPVGPNFLVSHLEQMTQDVVASVGPITGIDGDFWDFYQRRLSSRRRDRFLQGETFVGTTSNIMMRSWALREVGGFDLRYRRYGFEDRDLLIRLSAVGKISWCDDAVVRHMDRLTLVGVSKKMRTAGRESSRLFAIQHPSEYRALGYASVDARIHPCLRFPGRLLGNFVDHMARIFDALQGRGLVPWVLGLPIVKTVSAISYLAGTSEAVARDAYTLE